MYVVTVIGAFGVKEKVFQDFHEALKYRDEINASGIATATIRKEDKDE